VGGQPPWSAGDGPDLDADLGPILVPGRRGRRVGGALRAQARDGGRRGDGRQNVTPHHGDPAAGVRSGVRLRVRQGRPHRPGLPAWHLPRHRHQPHPPACRADRTRRRRHSTQTTARVWRRGQVARPQCLYVLQEFGHGTLGLPVPRTASPSTAT